MKLTKEKSFREVWSLETYIGDHGAVICLLTCKKRNSDGVFVPMKHRGGFNGVAFNERHVGGLIDLLAEYAKQNGGANA
ncbi:hypothetical protein CCR94_01945 [Rhodoblastus sphagnicola]|uniref:Uncharacterized protein n=1 Tax=Rhodoblastus sphagnicola TaxID=333368 RepID=A0A2S6NFL5_9HYPH|nr:hypothetical protein [Rhodoblastus sphagnicola]MBB4199207.1 hypothetical protein [Rhodoblastus sphagnicola]PPQ33384.1 hypothetical protein CCR94_01945 [Rhodoblastus sphagnicola]